MLDPAPGTDRQDPVNRAWPEHAPQEVIQGNDSGGCDQDPPVAVKSQERERDENAEVSLDSTSHQVDQQGADEHLPDRQGMARDRLHRAGPGPEPNGRLTIAPPRMTVAQTMEMERNRLASPGIGGNHAGRMQRPPTIRSEAGPQRESRRRDSRRSTALGTILGHAPRWTEPGPDSPTAPSVIAETPS